MSSSNASSSSVQSQFRYAQPPSKVLHLRNLPWECSEEELIEMCRPFGRIVNTKCNVGANRNQAFVEFVDVNQAISMVSYYASSSEPAQIRGKSVYLQYSNRQEIVNNKGTGDVASNVLLVTFEGVEAGDVDVNQAISMVSYYASSSEPAQIRGKSVYLQYSNRQEIVNNKGTGDVASNVLLVTFEGVEAGDVSIDVLHLVFSAFGFVHKIATFEKTAGFQALIQFSDAETASSARSALDGRSIPRYLLPDHVGTCHLHISFSAHTDLTVKFQSHRSRDYTNPYLPVAPSAIEGAGQLGIGVDGKKEPESNVLLASIENMQYDVTIDVLHTIFSAFGTIQKIAMFEKNAGLQALIQYPNVQTAVAAREALEGHCIYEGGFCKLHLSYSRHTDLSVKANNDRSRDYTNPNPGLLPPILGSGSPLVPTTPGFPQTQQSFEAAGSSPYPFIPLTSAGGETLPQQGGPPLYQTQAIPGQSSPYSSLPFGQPSPANNGSLGHPYQSSYRAESGSMPLPNSGSSAFYM